MTSTTTPVPPTTSLSTMLPTLPTTLSQIYQPLLTASPTPKKLRCKFHNLPKKWSNWSPFNHFHLHHMMVCKHMALTRKTKTVSTTKSIPSIKKTENDIIPVEVITTNIYSILPTVDGWLDVTLWHWLTHVSARI